MVNVAVAAGKFEVCTSTVAEPGVAIKFPGTVAVMELAVDPETLSCTPLNRTSNPAPAKPLPAMTSAKSPDRAGTDDGVNPVIASGVVTVKFTAADAYPLGSWMVTGTIPSDAIKLFGTVT